MVRLSTRVITYLFHYRCLDSNASNNKTSLVSDSKRKQLFNQLVHEFRNTGKTQASSHGAAVYPSGAVSHLGASSSNIAASALNGGIKPKKSHSIDKKGTMSSSQVQQQLQIVASLSGGSSGGPDSKKIPAKKGKTDFFHNTIAGSHKKSKSYLSANITDMVFQNAQ